MQEKLIAVLIGRHGRQEHLDTTLHVLVKAWAGEVLGAHAQALDGAGKPRRFCHDAAYLEFAGVIELPKAVCIEGGVQGEHAQSAQTECQAQQGPALCGRAPAEQKD